MIRCMNLADGTPHGYSVLATISYVDEKMIFDTELDLYGIKLREFFDCTDILMLFET